MRSASVRGRAAPPLPSIATTTSSSSVATRPSGALSVTLAVTLVVPSCASSADPTATRSVEPQLAAVVDRRPPGDVVPAVARIAAELRAEPVVEHLLRVGEVDGLVDVAVGVEIAPADLDALLVGHAAILPDCRRERPRVRSADRGVAQPGSALALGARSRRFESGRPDLLAQDRHPPRGGRRSREDP